MFNKLLDDQNLSPFTGSEAAFLVEYQRALGPVATALDLLQGEQYSYLGCLLPVIADLKHKIQAMLDGLGGKFYYCRPLLLVLKEAINKRFTAQYDDRNYLLASMVHPAWKLTWALLVDEDKINEMRELLISEIASQMRENDPQAQSSVPVTAEESQSLLATHREKAMAHKMALDVDSEEEDDGGPMASILKAAARYQAKSNGSGMGNKTWSDKARELVSAWEATKNTDKLDDEAFLGSRVLIDLFLKLNTGVVSSAAVERFFSQGKDTLRAKRSNLSDANFESLMFLRGNAHLWAAPSARRRRELSKRPAHPVLEAMKDKIIDKED